MSNANECLNRLEKFINEHVAPVNAIERFDWLKAYASEDDATADALAARLSAADGDERCARLVSEMVWLREFLPDVT
jgi:hypothetical protein